jgi:hypothetical protein
MRKSSLSFQVLAAIPLPVLRLFLGFVESVERGPLIVWPAERLLRIVALGRVRLKPPVENILAESAVFKNPSITIIYST